MERLFFPLGEIRFSFPCSIGDYEELDAIMPRVRGANRHLFFVARCPVSKVRLSVGLFVASWGHSRGRGAMSFSYYEAIWVISGIVALAASCLSMTLIFKHLQHYTKPHLQKYIIRILWMIPVRSLPLEIPSMARSRTQCSRSTL